MARARNIKPSLFKNEVLGTADPLLTILFESLWCLADREGILEDRPLRIKAETFPYRDVDVNGYLTELERLGFIWRYHDGETALIQVRKFSEHQHPHNTEKHTVYLTYKAVTALTVRQPLPNGYKPSDSLNTDLLIPDLETQEACANYRDDVLAGLREEMKLNLLPKESEWLEQIEWAFVNKIPAADFLETYRLMKKQTWRTGRISAESVAKNIPDLARLRIEIATQGKPPDVGAHDPTDESERANCQDCCDTGTVLTYPDPSQPWIFEKHPCPNGCKAEAIAA